uniref:Sarcalumenin n=1 Tax=Lygus hesperus TaxID=30085 RepID=A0A146M1R5_LYGHE
MFPRIFFIFFLVLSPSFGSESEGPSETECRPYIEKALQREGATQESGHPIDDVGEPLQLDETIDGSKNDATSGEEASDSGEPLEDTGGSSPPGVEVVPEASSEITGEALFHEDVLESKVEEGSEDPSTTESSQSEEAVAPEESSTLEGSADPVEGESSTASEEQAAQNEEEVGSESQEHQETEGNSVEEIAETPIGEVSSSEDESGQSETVEGENNAEQTNTESELPSTESLEGDEQERSPSVEVDGTEVVSEEVQSPEPESSDKLPLESAESDQVKIEDEIIPEQEAQTQDSASVVDEQLSVGDSTPVEDSAVSAEDPSGPAEVTAIPAETESVESKETSVENDSAEPSAPEGTVSNESASAKEELSSVEGEIAVTEGDSGSVEENPEPIEEPSTSSNAETQTASEDVSTHSSANPQAALNTTAEHEALPSDEQLTEPNPEADSPNNEVNPTSPVEHSTQSVEEGGNEPALPEEELIMPIEIPSNLRTRQHMAQILKLGPDADDKEKLLAKTIDNTLRDLKKLYDVAIKPLEILYKYRDLSNRHFGDPEIFSKPLILFMGPWSGGKSTIINYLLENEFKRTALRSGAEPSPAYFNIVMHGEKEEILDGTQLAADWTFSGLQKFGQGLLDRLRGLRLNHPLLQKVNIVEIPGILEIRKQVERLFPFNDACQWFIDRADIIFLVYDPSKLDVGPETEAILDQLKGREMQTRIILNKADQVKPEELMRVQGTLIWNISPLMSSTEPPVMYSTSLWSLPYEVGAPARLLYAQECGFLNDLREAIDKRVENKIASARRFAVRVRNHAKMVDCYLTTYYNHKTFFGNKKKVSDDIIEHPQNYHIYEGLSTLTNISRYDLPDPDVYKDFFRLNPVYEFQQLAATCTYFRGCPINRLDVAIAYDLPELIGKYRKSVEEVLSTRK